MKFRAIVKAATMLVFTMIFGNSLQADVALPKIFGKDMVLQRGQKVPVWGWADAGEKVTVKFDGGKVLEVQHSERVRRGPDGNKLDGVRVIRYPLEHI